MNLFLHIEQPEPAPVFATDREDSLDQDPEVLASR